MDAPLDQAPQVHNRPSELTPLADAMLRALKPDEAAPSEPPPADEPDQPAAVPDEAPQAASEPPDEVQQIALDDIWDHEISIANSDDKITVGELKNRYQDLQGVEKMRAETESARDEFRREQMVLRQQFETLASMLPKESITPELVQQAEQLVSEGVEAERRRTLQVLPEWADQATEQAARKAIFETELQGYGLSLGEVQMLQDHRLLKYLADKTATSKRLQVIKAEPERQKAVKPQSKAPPRTAQDEIASIKADRKAGRITEEQALTAAMLASLKGQKHGAQQRTNR